MKSSYIELNCTVSGIERLNIQIQVSYYFFINKISQSEILRILYLLMIHLFIELHSIPPSTLPTLTSSSTTKQTQAPPYQQ
jgi:hypothetical protein